MRILMDECDMLCILIMGILVVKIVWVFYYIKIHNGS